MLKELAAKIASAHNPIITFTVLSCALLLFFAAAIAAPAYRVVALHTSGKTYFLQVADSAGARQTGLTGRKSMPLNGGMLFSYSDSATRCYWMKGMNFPLDIIWLSTEKQIEYIQPNASPYSYPQQFCPNSPAKYVIELNAGVAESAQLHKGEILNF